uniref:Uncharacterized protein n=1 Tax=Lygus hesperus TaxID=30085 RepID=A0A146LLF3_LYGHE
MVFGRDFQNSRDGARVGINAVPDQLSNILVNENDVNVISFDEPFEGVLDFSNTRVFVHYHEVGLAILVDFADTTQEESHTCVLISDDRQQFPFYRGVKSHVAIQESNFRLFDEFWTNFREQIQEQERTQEQEVYLPPLTTR